MANIELKINKDVPQYRCDLCSNCNSLLGQSLCSDKHRGCCWYSPKFTLYEIHKMVKSEDGLQLLNRIRNMDSVEIYNYYIVVKSNFDKSSYENFTKYHSDILESKNVEDKTMFFKSCRFVEEGVGCTIPAEYRNHVCNLFICEEIIDKLKENEEFKHYLNERNTYVKWMAWENDSLQMMFAQQNLNLSNNFDEIINIFKEMPLENYEFMKLKSISI